MGKTLGTLAALAFGATLWAAPVMAAESSDSLETRLSNVERVVQRQAEIIAQQQRELNERGSAIATLQAGAGAGAAEAPRLPSWMSGLTYSGDLRLRYEGITYDDPDAKNRNHGRVRLRFGMEKKITDEVMAGLRLASGSSDDPTSTNQTFTDDFSEKMIWFDLAYITYKPAWCGSTTIGAGKVKNPFKTTNMVWDSDVNPEGVYTITSLPGTDAFKPFVTTAFFMAKDQSSAHDANMAGVQGGFDLTVADNLKWTLVGTYYDWFEIEEPGNFYSARGNTVSDGFLTADDFDILNVTNYLSTSVADRPLSFFVDYAKNIGEDAPAPDSGKDTAYSAGLTYGSAKAKGDWSVSYAYKRIEANAVVGSFVDSDFGYANRKGHVVSAAYALHKNVTAELTGIFAKPVSDAASQETATVLADLVFKW